MNTRTLRNGLIAVTPLWILIALAIIFWHETMMVAAGIVCLHFLRARLLGRRTRSSFAANVKAVAIAYAAWQSRWVNPNKRLTVPAKAGPERRLYGDSLDDIPY